MTILRQVIAAKGRLSEQDAIFQAHQACQTGENQDRTLLVGANLLRAQKYNTALDVLDEVQQAPEEWLTVKLH